MSRQTDTRAAETNEDRFTGSVFKTRVNIDPKHRDHAAFMHVVSGEYEKDMRLHQVCTARDAAISDAPTFIVGDHSRVGEACLGDILGLHSHDTIQIGDAFTRGEMIKFTGIPDFTSELFRRIRLKDPLKQKQLLKELVQLSEEGAVQVFRLISNNDLIADVVGVLQFDVVVAHLKSEYNAEAVCESVNVAIARWVECADVKKSEELRRKSESQLALDGGGSLAYIATSVVDLRPTQGRYPDVQFHQTREH